ncbi:HISN3, partial [Symbiodinium sp. KB8]
MLGGGNKAAALEALAAYPGGLQVGGGITDENAAEFIAAGASHVIVTSFVFRDGKLDTERLQKLMDSVGKEHLVLDLSCRKRVFVVVTDRWQKWTDFVVNAGSLSTLAAYCDEFLVHGVDVEGKQCGVEEELVAVLGAHSPIPVTYAGG